VADPLLQRAHGIFRLHCLGPNNVGDLEVEGHILPARHQHVILPLLQHSFSTYRLEVVARSICSSSALLVDDPNQPAMVSGGVRLGGRSEGGLSIRSVPRYYMQSVLLRRWFGMREGGWCCGGGVRGSGSCEL
jgi:hypothetical protein